ncbi:MAG: glycosyltransferase [Sandaracinaceae bacterium]|nr:glycosyltransferase [Sandaracinaceae bacterium]
MRIVLATVGTRGDVQPMLALAQALARRGHAPLLACPDTFGAWVGSFGIEHAPLGEDLQAMMREKGATFSRSLAGMKQYFAEQLLAQAPRLLELSNDADAIVGTAMAWSAPSIGEKRGIPALELIPSSCVPSDMHPPPMMPFYGWPRWMNRVLWWLNDRIQDSLMGHALNGARAAIGLGPVRSFTRHLFLDTPGVLACDDAFLPPDPTWDPHWRYAGFLFLDDPTPLDPALAAWLDAGDRPICVGFGSMAGGHPERVGAMLEAAIPRDRRCLVLGGAAELFAGRALPERFFAVASAPHPSLFPRCALVVHHGGSGTTAAALRAGVPQVILPMLLDQFHHAHHLVRAGLGPRAPSLAKVSTRALERAIDEALVWPEAPRRAMAARLEKSDAGGVITDHLAALVRERGAHPPPAS